MRDFKLAINFNFEKKNINNKFITVNVNFTSYKYIFYLLFLCQNIIFLSVLISILL